MTLDTAPKYVAPGPDPQLVQGLLGALFLGIITMLSLPAARGDSAWFGTMPLWLLGMPLAALTALYLSGFARSAPQSVVTAMRPRRGSAALPARRRGAATVRARLPRAA